MGEDAKERGARKVGGAGKTKKEVRAAPSLPSFLPFYFRDCAFSIQQTRISRSLEQASAPVPQRFNSIQFNQLYLNSLIWPRWMCAAEHGMVSES